MTSPLQPAPKPDTLVRVTTHDTYLTTPPTHSLTHPAIRFARSPPRKKDAFQQKKNRANPVVNMEYGSDPKQDEHSVVERGVLRSSAGLVEYSMCECCRGIAIKCHPVEWPIQRRNNGRRGERVRCVVVCVRRDFSMREGRSGEGRTCSVLDMVEQVE
ncbi:hypothetical protein B9Z19DRAFT_672376 [Tuber borchii]|uniref:Uncharacterized protein n=1 Tax=Tuber borchii TaxID=42251 RepID=A0A2T6ZZQ7_TUBBO|nr:hypothetical protein B9Z19DRAFT_672376 [Tuber borchii]